MTTTTLDPLDVDIVKEWLLEEGAKKVWSGGGVTLTEGIQMLAAACVLGADEVTTKKVARITDRAFEDARDVVMGNV